MNIIKEQRKCFIPDHDFYSIPLAEATGGKVVVIAKNKEEAIQQLTIQLKLHTLNKNTKKE